MSWESSRWFCEACGLPWPYVHLPSQLDICPSCGGQLITDDEGEEE